MVKQTTKRKVKTKQAMPKARSPYVVFISHSSADRWIARKMAEGVEALGAQAWLDEKDLVGGDIIADEIRRGIDDCDEAIVLVSHKSVNSQWVVFEIGAVWGQHKRVTPVLNNIGPEAMAPMREVRAIDLNEFDEFLIQLRRRMDERWQGKEK
jgi:hypothetical protein